MLHRLSGPAPRLRLSLSNRKTWPRCFASVPNEPLPRSVEPDDQAMEERLAGSMGFLVSIFRAIESARDDAICNDPFVDALSRKARPMLLPLVQQWSKTEFEQSNYMGLRTRYHDDALNSRSPDIRQLVLLGAGLDARAYYMESLRGCHVLKVDESAIFAHKKQVLHELGASLVAEKDDCIVANLMDPEWESKLLEKGFDPSMPAFWSMEGLLMYFDRASNVKLLKAIDALSAPGSELWAEMPGEVITKSAELKLVATVEGMKKEESRGGMLRYGEDDPMHGVLSEIPWKLELQASLVSPGTHFGREWTPLLSDESNEPVPFSFMTAKKPEQKFPESK